MKLGLKEIGAVAALATAGCTSPDLEDNKNETHPVCAVPDASSDTITEERVKAIITECATVNVQEQSRIVSEYPYAGSGAVAAAVFDIATDAGKQAEKACLALHGLDNSE